MQACLSVARWRKERKLEYQQIVAAKLDSLGLVSKY